MSLNNTILWVIISCSQKQPMGLVFFTGQESSVKINLTEKEDVAVWQSFCNGFHSSFKNISVFFFLKSRNSSWGKHKTVQHTANVEHWCFMVHPLRESWLCEEVGEGENTETAWQERERNRWETHRFWFLSLFPSLPTSQHSCVDKSTEASGPARYP